MSPFSSLWTLHFLSLTYKVWMQQISVEYPRGLPRAIWGQRETASGCLIGSRLHNCSLCVLVLLWYLHHLQCCFDFLISDLSSALSSLGSFRLHTSLMVLLLYIYVLYVFLIYGHAPSIFSSHSNLTAFLCVISSSKFPSSNPSD